MERKGRLVLLLERPSYLSGAFDERCGGWLFISRGSPSQGCRSRSSASTGPSCGPRVRSPRKTGRGCSPSSARSSGSTRTQWATRTSTTLSSSSAVATSSFRSSKIPLSPVSRCGNPRLIPPPHEALRTNETHQKEKGRVKTEVT